MRKIALPISAAALACGAIAYAQAEAPSGPQADMTRAQAQAKAEQMFDKLDVNHDGVLNQADRDARKAMMFDKIDTNKDGSISKDEFMAAHDRMGRHGPQGMGADGERGPGKWAGKDGQRMHRGPNHERMGGMMLMHMADPDHTGTVTKQAFVNAALTMFDKADANHDGTVTAAEHKAAHQAMRARMKAKMAEKRAERQQQN